MRIKLVLVLLSCLCFSNVRKDPVFTQYFLVPETLNPGFYFMETTMPEFFIENNGLI
jgi:hypothetical protein